MHLDLNGFVWLTVLVQYPSYSIFLHFQFFKLRPHVNIAKVPPSPILCFRSRSVIRIHATVRFEPSKVNIFNKDCRRGGKDVTCMSAIVCLNVTARTVVKPTQEVGQSSKLFILLWIATAYILLQTPT